jgi:hypothetical protein
MSIYKNTSPYYTTDDSNGYLDVMTYRNIIAETDDILYTIDKKYENRPDLLAYDVYKNVDFWWVFAMRNVNVIKDPIYDFIAGTKIYLPKLSNIKTSLGV